MSLGDLANEERDELRSMVLLHMVATAVESSPVGPTNKFGHRWLQLMMVAAVGICWQLHLIQYWDIHISALTACLD